MIYAIQSTREYGKQGTTAVNLLPELSISSITTYAHSREQAMTWVKSHQAFKESEFLSLHDGRFTVSSKWIEKNDTLDIFYGHLYGHNDATHERQTMVLYPENTVFETVGYK